MSDNTTLNVGTGGDVYAADDISGVKFQRIKLVHGTDGVNAGDVATSNPLPIATPGSSRSDTYTTNVAGTTVDVSTKPCKHFGLQIVKSGAVTVWTVALEVSLDGVNFTTVLTHTESDGDLAVIWNPAPIAGLYFRSRCITRTGGTNVTAYIVGMN